MTAFLRLAVIVPLDLCSKQSGTVGVATHLKLHVAFSARASGLWSVAGPILALPDLRRRTPNGTILETDDQEGPADPDAEA